MVSLLNNIQNSSINRELYSSFIKKKKNNNPAQEKLQETGEFIKSKKKALAITSIGTLGTVGTALLMISFYAGNKRQAYKGIIQNIENKLEYLKFKQPEQLNNTVVKAQAFGKQVLSSWLNYDVIKNNVLLKAQNAFKPVKNILSPVTVDLPIKISAKMSKLKYKNFQKTVENMNFLSERVLKEYGSNLSKEDIARVKSLLGNGETERLGLSKVASTLSTGFNKRQANIQEVINKDIIKPFNEKYFPSKKQGLKTSLNNMGKDFLSKDMSRHNWDNVVTKLEDKVTNFNGVNLEETVERNSAEVIKILEKTGIKNKNAKLYRHLVNSRLAVENNFRKAKTFETQNFAGRALDLNLGGGILELATPPAVLAIFGKHIITAKDKDEKIDKMLTEGVGITGGISAWMISAWLLGINGAPALITAAVSGAVLDKTGKLIYKKFRKGKQHPPKQPEINKINNKKP